MRLARLVGLLLTLLAAPVAVEAQPAGKVARISLLCMNPPSTPTIAFRDALREQGYVEGQNLVLELRWAEGRIERLPELARKSVALNVDVIVAGGSPAAQAAKQATATLSIVGISGNQLVESSPCRPGA